MMKRLTWFVTGLIAGVTSVLLVGRRIKKRVADLAPVRMAERAVDRTRVSLGRVKDAIGDGRSAMVARESELRHRYLKDETSSWSSDVGTSAARRKQ